MKHVLIENSTTFSTSKERKPIFEGQYDTSKGYWTKQDGSAIILDKDFKDDNSKKCDIETGEDKKGE